MAIIGTFTRTSDSFSGTIKTLTLNSKVSIVPADREHDKAPDFRIFAGTLEIGAAWQKVSAADRDYLSCKIDDLSLPAPLYASLVTAQDGQGYALIWSR
ncbi:MAG TPA: DUF736 domain-containing protein [Sphingobium sp.]